MIKQNQRALNIFNALTDMALNFLAFYIAHWLRFSVFEKSAVHQPFSGYINAALVNAVATAVLYLLFQLYEAKRRSSFAKDLWIILQANFIDVLLLGMALYIWRFFDFSRLLLFLYFIVSMVLIVTKHSALRIALRKLRKSGRNLKHVLVIGSGNLANNYINEVKKNSRMGFRVDGVISCGTADEALPEGVVSLGEMGMLPSVLSNNDFDEAIIALDESEGHCTKAAIEECNIYGVRFSVIPYFTEYCFSATAPDVMNIGSVQVFDICASPLDSVINRFLKRFMDLAAAILIALITSPIMLIAAITVKLTSKGPVFFKQERVGLKKNTFNMYKFRSMKVNSQQDTGWSQKGDARVTAFGKFMRKTSIDELPQLFNIIKGDMSLVGPRPEIPFHVDHFKHEIPYYMARHQVRPGLTGWAQVNGYRGDTSIKKRIQHDLYYIYNWSLALDIRIIFKTIFGGIISKAE